MHRLTIAILGAVAALALAGCVRESGRESAPDDSPVVATVDGTAITQNEVDDYIRDQLFESQFLSRNAAQQYEARSAALQEMIGEKVLDAAAAAKNVDRETLISQEVEALGPVTDEEVAAFFEEHKARFRPPDNTLESRAAQIRSFLESQREATAAAKIHDAASVEISLEAPRVDVAALGPAIGPENAPVTIVEFSDFQCPYCGRAEPTLRKIVDRYGDKVRLVYRHYPLDRIHPRARAAAEAAVCAEKQGHFWAYHERLFANQRALSDEDLESYASDLGLDTEKFKACLADPEVKARVQADVDAAQAAGVSGTPAFFVNGIMLSGARSEQSFVELIDAELAASDGGADS